MKKYKALKVLAIFAFGFGTGSVIHGYIMHQKKSAFENYKNKAVRELTSYHLFERAVHDFCCEEKNNGIGNDIFKCVYNVIQTDEDSRPTQWTCGGHVTISDEEFQEEKIRTRWNLDRYEKN